jgi:hypothetical protein
MQSPVSRGVIRSNLFRGSNFLRFFRFMRGHWGLRAWCPLGIDALVNSNTRISPTGRTYLYHTTSSHSPPPYLSTHHGYTNFNPLPDSAPGFEGRLGSVGVKGNANGETWSLRNTGMMSNIRPPSRTIKLTYIYTPILSQFMCVNREQFLQSLQGAENPIFSMIAGSTLLNSPSSPPPIE